MLGLCVRVGPVAAAELRTHLAPAANPAGCLCHDVSLCTRKSPPCLIEAWFKLYEAELNNLATSNHDFFSD